MTTNEALIEVILSKNGINKLTSGNYSTIYNCMVTLAKAKDKAYKKCENLSEVKCDESLGEDFANGFNAAVNKIGTVEVANEYDFLLSCAKACFWEHFVKYLHNYAIGDTTNILEAVCTNETNEYIGYVETTKRIDEFGNIVIEFEHDKKFYSADWQENDNYACWQRTEFEDSYYGYLLFPTHKKNLYFCLWYRC